MDHLLGPFSRFFTCRLRSDPHVLNLKRAQKFVYHFTQSRFCSLLTTVFLTLPSALGSFFGSSRQKTETLICLPCHEHTANLSSSAAMWQENREKKEVVKTHPTFLEPQVLWSEKASARPVSTATVPVRDSLGPSVGENAVEIKAGTHTHTHTHTHTLSPRIPLSYSLCQKMKSHLEAPHLHLVGRPGLQVTLESSQRAPDEE